MSTITLTILGALSVFADLPVSDYGKAPHPDTPALRRLSNEPRRRQAETPFCEHGQIVFETHLHSDQGLVCKKKQNLNFDSVETSTYQECEELCKKKSDCNFIRYSGVKCVMHGGCDWVQKKRKDLVRTEPFAATFKKVCVPIPGPVEDDPEVISVKSTSQCGKDHFEVYLTSADELVCKKDRDVYFESFQDIEMDECEDLCLATPVCEFYRYGTANNGNCALHGGCDMVATKRRDLERDGPFAPTLRRVRCEESAPVTPIVPTEEPMPTEAPMPIEDSEPEKEEDFKSDETSNPSETPDYVKPYEREPCDYHRKRDCQNDSSCSWMTHPRNAKCVLTELLFDVPCGDYYRKLDCERNSSCAWLKRLGASTCVEDMEPAEYFLVKEGFNCKNQALDYIKDKEECIRAAESLGVEITAHPSTSDSAQDYCGTSDGMTFLTFNKRADIPDYGYSLATEDSFQICKRKTSPWADETCGRELCIPEILKTDDPMKFDLSKVEWTYFGNGASVGNIPGYEWKPNVLLFNLTSEFKPYFHYHTNFHSGWILHGSKKTFGLDQDGNDDKYIKPVGTYFAVDKKYWHTEKQNAPWTVIYLRFVDYMDQILPKSENRQFVKSLKEAGFLA